jgi:hypothetical protein
MTVGWNSAPRSGMPDLGMIDAQVGNSRLACAYSTVSSDDEEASQPVDYAAARLILLSQSLFRRHPGSRVAAIRDP